VITSGYYVLLNWETDRSRTFSHSPIDIEYM